MHEIRSTILSGEGRAATPIARKAKNGRGETPSGLAKIAIRRQETRVTNQRAEDRLMNVVEQTTIVFRRKKLDVRVVNVSSRGAMLDAPVEPRIGEKIDILFADHNRTRCVVRWVRGSRVGVEFLNETIFWESAGGEGPFFRIEPEPQAPTASAPRAVTERAARQALLRRGTLYWSGITIPVRLRNISAGGARLDSDRELVPGSEVELDLGEAGFQVAEVRWSKDGQVGLRFADEFNLDSLAPSPAATAGPVPDVLKPAYLETEMQPDSPWAARFERLSMTDLKMIDPEG
jgi:PilZ domain